MKPGFTAFFLVRETAIPIQFILFFIQSKLCTFSNFFEPFLDSTILWAGNFPAFLSL